jgi:hypothetical protein
MNINERSMNFEHQRAWNRENKQLTSICDSGTLTSTLMSGADW